MKKYFYALADRTTAGPVSVEELKALRLAGTIQATSWVIEQGGSEWTSYRSLGLSDVVAPGAPLPAIPTSEPMNLLLKRCLTAGALFLPLTVFLWFGSLMIGGMIIGGMASAAHATTDYQTNYQTQYKAGATFGRTYGGVLLLAALVISAVGSLLISFSNLLPWCRK